MSTYSEKLKDPRWQRKRLEIMQKHDFRCQICKDSRQELHIHHKHYINGREPWEYSEYELDCLCLDCHSLSHIPNEKIRAFGRANHLQMKTVSITQRLFPRKLMMSADSISTIELVKLRAEASKEYSMLRHSISERWQKIIESEIERNKNSDRQNLDKE